MKWYAAGGSSNTPADVLDLMSRVAAVMSSKGIMLRCGEMSEADRTFIKGSKGKFHSFVPFGFTDELEGDGEAGTSFSPWAIQSDIGPSSGDATFARSLNPGFLMLPKVEKQWDVVANSLIYGLDRVSLAKMLICWSEPGDHVERYIKKAEKAGVTVLNLALPQDRKKVESWTR